MLKIGIAGTFDVQNFGDLLFPLIAEAELTRRLGTIDLHRFSYGAKKQRTWPFTVTSIADLPGQVGDLDAMIIGGGDLIRFDKGVAPGYLPPNADIHHPTGYWLMPALLAQQNGCAVAWNALSAFGIIPDWAAPLMRTAIAYSGYVAVRDAPTHDRLAPFANGKSIAVVPDTCFGISRLVDRHSPSARYAVLREAAGLTRPYIIVQPVAALAGFASFVRKHRERLAGYQFVSLPISPALGDNDATLAGEFDELVTLPSWPDPLLIAELIAGASAVVGVSLHLAITALSFGVPLFRPGDAFVGKFAILPQHASVHTFSMDGEIDPDWFVRTLDQSEQTSELPGILRALDTHWDKVAACVSASPRNQNAEDIFGKFLPRLPALLEAEAERDGMRELLRAQYRTVSMRDRRVASTYGTGGNKTPVDLEGEDMLNIDAAPDGRAVLPGEPAMEAAIIAERDRQISLRDRKIQELTAAIEERDRRIAALTNAANQLNGLIQSRNEEVRALRQSTSWTITAPLRRLSATMRGGDAESNIIRFEKLEQQKLNTEPYDWAFANDVFAPRDARSLVDTYPRDHFKTVKGYDGEKGYEYEARALIHMGSSSISYADELSGAWRRLVNDLLSADYRAAMTRLIARDLMSAPMEAYVCHFGPGAWLGPHLDLKDKIMTHVFYFNEAWDPRDGGCLNILRSRSMSDSIAEVPPVVGNTSVLVRSNNSWHSVSRVAEGCQTSRRSMNVIFYHPGAVSTMWPPGDSTPLHRYDPPEG